MIKINVNCQKLVKPEDFLFLHPCRSSCETAVAIFLLVYAPISVKGDSPFWKRGACRHSQPACLYWFGIVAQSIERIYQHLIFLSTSIRVEASMSPVQEASSLLEDLKRLIVRSDWALGGLAVIGTFCLVFVALILFAAIFGCCSSPRHK